MAVAFQAQGTSQTTSTPTTSMTFTKLTVASGSDRCLVVAIAFGGNPGAFTKKNWDDTGTPQDLTLIASAAASDNLGFVYLFGLVNPNVGNNTLALTWTNSIDFCCDAVSFTGVDQTGSATTFKNANNLVGNGTSPQAIEIVSPSGDMAVAGFAGSVVSFGVASVGTEVFADNTNVSAAMMYNAGVGYTSISIVLTTGGGTPMVIVGCDIAMAPTADMMPQILM